MSVVRTPISLKFEDDTSSFYLGLIEPLKENRNLSTFIMDLLKFYYEREDVRLMFEEFKAQNGPLAEIQKQINRIAMSHQKTMTTTGILGDLMAEAENGTYSEPNSSNVNGDSVAQKVERLEKTVPEIENKVDKVLEIVSALSKNGVSVNTVNTVEQPKNADNLALPETTYQNVQTSQPTAQVQQLEQVPKQQIEVPIAQPQVQNVQYESPVNSAPTFAQPEVVMPTVTVQPNIPVQTQQVSQTAPVVSQPIIPNAPVIESTPTVSSSGSSSSDGGTVKKAGSFGKLMGSLKK